MADSIEVQVEKLAWKFKGQIVVSVKEETWSKVEEEYRNAVVAKLSTGKGFNIKAMANLLKKAWNVQNGVKFQEIKNNMAIIMFMEERHLRRVLEAGPWFFNGAVVLTARWEEGRSPKELVFDGIKMWMQVHNLPIGFTENGVARGFAEIDRKIRKESSIEDEIVKAQYARYQIEISIYEPVKKGCYLRNQQGELTWIDFKYKKMPSLCSKCGCISHYKDKCLADLTEAEEQEQLDGQALGRNEDGLGSQEGSNKKRAQAENGDGTERRLKSVKEVGGHQMLRQREVGIPRVR